ncbi:MAG: hypothetical protein JO080_14750 [Mucilaginibacter sp.]|nr:hypothetical protein [Mucilaginibacter sp.]
MIRKFNYTGRVKIPEKFAKIKIFENGNSSYFNAYLDIQNLNFPESAKVFVEPYFNANFLRFDYGTIGHLQPPAKTFLNDLPNIDQLRFRVKVIDASDELHKIIGIADNIYPEGLLNDGNRKSILPVLFDDIGNQIWKVDIRNDGPVLIMNNEENYPGIRNHIKSNPYFLGLIYPIAIRFILDKIIQDDLFDSEEWSLHWLTFTREVLGVYPTPSDANDPSIDTWVEDVVNSYCVKFKLLENIQKN